LEKNANNLIIRHFESANQKNEYLLIDKDEAATIDVSHAYGEASQILTEMGIGLKYLLVTHAHKSRVQALKKLKDNFGGTFCLHDFEIDHLHESDSSLVPDRLLKDNDLLTLGDTSIQVLLTPGHTRGSVCFYARAAQALFSGSSLLKQGYGKIWGPQSMSLMLFSLKRLSYTIPAKTRIYTGSGELTTMGKEGWIQCLRSA
jgi:glyoxylase-like metal-dependent hydrolase (beta-lactamase superfamily II)